MGSPSRGRPGNTAGPSCYRERGLSYSAVDGIQGTLGREAQHDRLRVIQDPGNRHADRLDAAQALTRLGKHEGRRATGDSGTRRGFCSQVPKERIGVYSVVHIAPRWVFCPVKRGA